MTDPIHAQLDALDRLRAEARLKELAQGLTDEPISDQMIALAVTEGGASLAVAARPVRSEPKALQREARAIVGQGLGMALGVTSGLMLWAGSHVSTGLEPLSQGLDMSAWWTLSASFGVAAVGTWAWAMKQEKELQEGPVRRWTRRVMTGMLAGMMGYMVTAKITAEVELHTDIGIQAQLAKDIDAWSATRQAVDHALGQDAPGSIEAKYAVEAPQCELAQKRVADYVAQPGSKVGMLLRGALAQRLHQAGCTSGADLFKTNQQLLARAQAQVNLFDALPKPKGLDARPSILASLARLNSRERWCEASPEWTEATPALERLEICQAISDPDRLVSAPVTLHDLGVPPSAP